jgi:hypothetical protein
MKKLAKISILLTILSIVSISCNKNEFEDIPTSDSKIEKVSVKEIKLVNTQFKNFDNFLKSESYKIVKANITDLKIESVQAVSFNEKSIFGFIIKIDDSNGYSRDLMAIYNEDEPEEFTTMLRESSIKNIDEKINGDVIWRTATYDKLNEITITNNKVSHFKLYTPDKPFSSKNARFAATQSCKWTCTNAQFNAAYQKAKDDCEKDWYCDAMCTFNPCVIAYLAVATDQCYRCNFE